LDAEDAKEEFDFSDVQFAVLYYQTKVKNKEIPFNKLFKNVHGLKDADFEMDIDHNINESITLFYDVLEGHAREGEGAVKFLKRPENQQTTYMGDYEEESSDDEDRLIREMEKEMGLAPKEEEKKDEENKETTPKNKESESKGEGEGEGGDEDGKNDVEGKVEEKEVEAEQKTEAVEEGLDKKEEEHEAESEPTKVTDEQLDDLLDDLL